MLDITYTDRNRQLKLERAVKKLNLHQTSTIKKLNLHQTSLFS